MHNHPAERRCPPAIYRTVDGSVSNETSHILRIFSAALARFNAWSRWVPLQVAAATLCNKCLQLSLDPGTTPAVAGAAPASSASEARRYVAPDTSAPAGAMFPSCRTQYASDPSPIDSEV